MSAFNEPVIGPPLKLWESGNPALWAGFPSAEENPRRTAARTTHSRSPRDARIAVDHALVLQRENPPQILPPSGKNALSGCCRHRKLPVELRDVVFPQETVGLFPRANPAQPQFLRQPSLPGADVALTAPARLGEYAGIMAMPSSRSARPTLPQFAGLRRQPEMAGAIAVERTENPALLDHRAQRPEHRLGR
jgi:hypothetical protein